MDGEQEVPLPYSVNRLINDICLQKLLPSPDIASRRCLSKIGEESAINILKKISTCTTKIYNLSGFIVFMVKKYGPSSVGEADSVRVISYPSSPCSDATTTRRTWEKNSLPLKARTTKAERRAMQEAQRAAKASAKESALYDSRTMREFLESSYSCSGASPVITQHYAPTNSSNSGLSCPRLEDALPAYRPSVSHNVSPHVNRLISSPDSALMGTNRNKMDDSPVQKKLFAPSGTWEKNSLPLKARTTKAERRAMQEAQRAAKAERRAMQEAQRAAKASAKASAIYDSPTMKEFLESSYSCSGASRVNTHHYAPSNSSNSGLSCSSLEDALPTYRPSASHNVSPHVNRLISSPGSALMRTNNNKMDGSPVQKKLFAPSADLSELEFRKLFMVHSYIGRNKLEDCVSVETAKEIKSMKSWPMYKFESWMWINFGSRYCQESDRARSLDWDSGKTHVYTCYVYANGAYQFKGPYLDSKITHLQRSIGDENVLVVKFEEADMQTYRNYEWIAKEGILVGLRRYRFFVSKDGGRERRTDGKEDKKRDSFVKCHFVRDDLLNYKTTHGLRCLFMHVHMVPNMSKYMARLSLILSTTIKLQVDLASVSVEEIPDIPCIDENGCIVCDEDGEPMIQTDGTGFISEDLAVLVPNDFQDAKYMKDKDYEKFGLSAGLGGRHVPVRETPLLIQCRLYHEGSAVKGTLLVNKKLKRRTIQVRPSMIKVRKDPNLSDARSFNSLEIVSVSHKPKGAKLSKYLIALLSIGGVPKEYFLDLLADALNDLQRVCFDRRAAFRIANIQQHIDDYGNCMEMFGALIPLTEPYFQHRLSFLAKEERKGLGEGKIPIPESFYLIGTTDPTGTLNSDEVCIILESGQISGKVLVYRNPGLHFGDIHVLNARYVKELEEYIGNSKFGIFFSTKGRRSVANEIANGDFDGDNYWVSRNPQLLSHFRSCEPWTRIHSTPNAPSKKPSDLSSEELESELFQMLFLSKTESSAAGIAADSWLAFMDRYLVLQDNDGGDNEKHAIKEKMLHLIDLYYDAIDAAKHGKKVVIPYDLKATRYPHHMNRKSQYHSTSILGNIYDEFQKSQNEKLPVQEIWKLPDFDIGMRGIPDSCLKLWTERYKFYREDMRNAMKYNDQSTNDSASSVIAKYKQMLYEASDFKDSTKNIDDLFDEALAIYHVSYDYAKSINDVAKCGFAWKVAGSALCAYHRKICMKSREREITFLSSAFDGIF